MKIKKIAKIIFIIIILIFCFIYFSGLGKTTLSIMKYYAPFNLGNKFKEKVNVFNNLSKIKTKKIDLEKIIGDIPNNIGYIPIKLIPSKKNLIINNNIFNIKKFEISLLLISKNQLFKTKGNSYIDYHDKKLFVVSGNGIFSYVNVDEFKKNNSKLLIIPTNIKKIIKYDDFFTNSKFGIKDILIKNNNIYISYTNNIKKNCFNVSILVAKINTKMLRFKKFFTPADYDSVCKDYVDFNAHSSGGRIVEFKDNKLLFSTGEFLDSAKAQISKNTLGKILEINENGKGYKLVSKGHRNVQGLFYDKESNVIYSTEHGPFGGDEININNLKNDKIKNYGWPISSYGEHYGGKSLLNRLTRYIKYPLHKSHKEYGFIEPLKYFVPSIGISEIILLNNDFLFAKNKQILVSSLSGKSLHYLQINDQKIVKDLTININERIRDMIYVEGKEMIFLSLENTNENSKIGIIYN
tara:strand:+ start:939 stop:2336 length:1398 start_codon:yes stop_codon:yes gene_type:complete